MTALPPEADIKLILLERSANDPKPTLARFCKMKNSLIQSGVLLHGERCRSQNAAFLRSFSVVLFLLPLLFVHLAYADINDELYQAAVAGNTGKVEQLLRKGADVNARSKKGRTALMVAAQRGHTETVKVLIAAGADVNARSNKARLP